MIFYKANALEWRRVLRIMGTYEARFGQKVNLSKTSLFFSRNTWKKAFKLEVQISIIGRERSSFEGSDLGNTHLLYECFHVACLFV
jgi:hypothetical protein